MELIPSPTLQCQKRLSLSAHSLHGGAALADWVGSTASSDAGWLRTAARVKVATNKLHWDGPVGAFRNNLCPTPRAGLHPQDDNSLAVLFEIIGPSSSRAQDISSPLMQNWTPIGAASPKLLGEISPFISSFEI
ncbi:hypothetical protein DL766_008459 [Monosporascus sp. MC13-8B]|uniref:Uncharacterized protein n=1 Tax=Monosporascus cannonballus TaxID=155416 RepID=A0ABY0GTU3_9PEZI|nr:hypothetical protein DL762_009390 [Monosporascus cannonballus]RYO98202.1 hypothetical protein DL763_002369 [Monosporascus cannonballus]RYP19378.1 hypothetical protein DL766_008459 [Monosporascus sp. MC13-8B]